MGLAQRRDFWRPTTGPANLSVKWAIYSHTMKDHKSVTAGQGTLTAKVDPFKTVTVNSGNCCPANRFHFPI